MKLNLNSAMDNYGHLDRKSRFLKSNQKAAQFSDRSDDYKDRRTISGLNGGPTTDPFEKALKIINKHFPEKRLAQSSMSPGNIYKRNTNNHHQNGPSPLNLTNH